MDLVKSLRRKNFARNQKATVFQSLRGILSIYAYAVLHCVSFSLIYRLHDVVSIWANHIATVTP
jgi:hypothetical protein